MRIAIVDSDPKQRARITQILRDAQHSCTPLSGFEKLVSDPDVDCDLLLCHWQAAATPSALPALQRVRQVRPLLPVLVLVAQAPDQALAGLLGEPHADYLVLPLRAHDLRLRVTLLHRQVSPQRQHSVLQFGAYAFDIDNGTACLDGKPITLTKKEFSLALLLFRHLGQPLSRATIHEAVWPKEAEFSSRSLDTHIARVRLKFALQPDRGYRLTPVYGYGYQLQATDFPG
jgi:DNA-binding response OmpR family regulator